MSDSKIDTPSKIFPALSLLLLLHLFREFDVLIETLARREVLDLKEPSHLDIGFMPRVRRWRPLRPFECFFVRLHLDDPISGDQFLRLRKRPTHNRFLPTREILHSKALRTPLQTRRIEQDARLRKLFVVGSHRCDQLLARHLPRLRVFARLHDHHVSHRLLSSDFDPGWCGSGLCRSNPASTVASN